MCTVALRHPPAHQNPELGALSPGVFSLVDAIALPGLGGRWSAAVQASPTAPSGLTLLSPFHLSTRWIRLKFLIPVNTVKSPELELLSCGRGREQRL